MGDPMGRPYDRLIYINFCDEPILFKILSVLHGWFLLTVGINPMSSSTIPALLRERAGADPEKVVLYFGEIEISYHDIDKITDSLARAIFVSPTFSIWPKRSDLRLIKPREL
jgi:hypothetical protein